MSELKTIRRPSYCPNCGSGVEMVRRVVSNIYELHCEGCNYGAVIHSDDQVKLPTTQIGSGNHAPSAKLELDR